MHRNLLGGLVMGLALLAGPSLDAAAPADDTLDLPRGRDVALDVDSGPIERPAVRGAIAWRTLVEIEDGAWGRLRFGDDTRLGPGSELRITALRDNARQVLDASALRAWGRSSAFLNGGRFEIELVSGPGARSDRVTIVGALVETVAEAAALAEALGGAAAGAPCGICGADDRFPSDEPWTGRLMPPGCTAFIFSESGCIATAGHCVDGFEDLVFQLNVPPSLGDCTLQMPAPVDQFPVIDQAFRNDGLGRDWGVLATAPNGVGSTAFQWAGELRTFGGLPAAGRPIDLFGYGWDDQCERHQTQQESPGGEIVDVLPTDGFVVFSGDVRFGSSGSAVLVNDEVVGIATNCSTDCVNAACLVGLADFVQARQELCPDVAPCAADFDGSGEIGTPDLLVLLAAWETPGADLDGDGTTNVTDLLALLSSWGPCP